MDAKYAYRGDEVAGAYVNRWLEACGCVRVEAVEEADAVFTHCFHTSAVEDAYFDEGGLIKHSRPGTLLVDLSASTPSLAREISAVASVNDLRFVEAPLAVTDPFSSEAWVSPQAMVCYLSGEADDCAAAVSFAEALAAEVHLTGNYGAAQLAKAMKTVLQASQVMGALEADALCHGLSERGYSEGPDPLLDVPFGQSLAEARKLIASGQFDSTYTVALFMSDVAAAMAAADDGELILPHLEAALHILELGGVIGAADRGLAVLGLLYRDEAEGASVGLDWSRAESLYAEGYGDGAEGSFDEGCEFPDGFGAYSDN